ncbi:MAG: sigma-54 dependent transcriptional regulator [Candidatus Thiodiazotropha lotti]|nr:sigma-54 dependent transcriptional regulator [Candidatus Thiodiazotropha lotti]
MGPIANAIADRSYDAIRLMANYSKKEVAPYVKWLKAKTDIPLHIDQHSLKNPTDFEEIFQACRKTLKALQSEIPDALQLTFHLSPGTPQMATTWIILSETEFPARLISSSKELGVQDVRLPLSITAEWLPSYINSRDARLEGAAPELPPQAAQFNNILYHSDVMKKIIYRASKVAPRSVPVLIEGESGTGKELFARAIHDASLRTDKPFIPVNCGALPRELIESTLFGHEKGAFTGATGSQVGKFVQADGGTLFLDELGELPLEAQVRFLRVLEDKEVWPVGAKKPTKVNVRIIAATNRSLIEEVTEGRFREDLFYRLAVAVLKLPPLRHRGEDVKLLIRHLLNQVNEESREEPSYKDKKLSPEGDKIMLEHAWPGNVRELLNTLRRLAVWSDGLIISEDEVREGLLTGPGGFRKSDDILAQEIGQHFDLTEILEKVERRYIEKAWLESGKRKKEAATLLGMPNYQTFTKRLEKYGLG